MAVKGQGAIADGNLVPVRVDIAGVAASEPERFMSGTWIMVVSFIDTFFSRTPVQGSVGIDHCACPRFPALARQVHLIGCDSM